MLGASQERIALRGRVFVEGAVTADAAVELEGPSIRRVADPGDIDGPFEELGECLLAPGFIDVHTHGAGGADFADPRPGAVARAARCKLAHGTTGFMASLISSPWVSISAALAHLGQFRATDPLGSALLGVHFEGPFLNAAMRGAHPAENLLAPALAIADEYLERVPRGLCAMFTVAPELPDGLALVEHLARSGAVVAQGHSRASYDQARQAMERGARHATHLFNAMAPLHHRNPGIAGAFLDEPEATVELIPDGTHVHPALLRLVSRLKGPAGIAAVTDSVPVAGLAPGTYEWLGREVALREAGAFLPGGTLAGSALDASGALRGLLAAGLSLAPALTMLTETPARLLGLWAERGSLSPGKRADLVVLDPNLRVTRTYLAGQRVA
ncbi:MAG: N-acetylglucosamine-6-phosphate deacetylase [Candidatus Wallbacteria bacterium]|nr:N-acetylglucosamine-6-phosphate deacetylase [Candidatus Wallbacteria bacterium]